ncbi:hypothetical protein FD723_40720 (plasmid) [Nostoc sp. C052]|uniref:hypothetical protein n=1 Tax=Nostoc sp. C052 TaxID=2576902 RepID=UPI0015C373D3|nr:hypothetical protein [Nostoc sp. C052]QLE46539.1 hypothetical protein FD723_40720 [Nostoc sp. C052]
MPNSKARLDRLEISATPPEEECLQVGIDDYPKKGRQQCNVFKQQLERQFPIPQHLEEILYFAVISCPHDFGSYYNVCVKFDGNNEEAVNYAYNVEANTPAYWDEDAKTELRSLGLLSDEDEE